MAKQHINEMDNSSGMKYIKDFEDPIKQDIIEVSNLFFSEYSFVCGKK